MIADADADRIRGLNPSAVIYDELQEAEAMTYPEDIDRLHGLEAIAAALAALDGRLDHFKACKADARVDDVEAGYSKYMAEANALLARIENRGFTITRNGVWPHDDA